MAIATSTSTPSQAGASSAEPAEQRVVFEQLDWTAYEQIVAALGDSHTARLTYDRGTLEIVMPSEEHKTAAEWIAVFVRILVEALGLELKSMGSTRLKYTALQRGAEPDKAFYIQNALQVSGRKVQFETDPPPDLVVEVDITHTDIDKNTFYASLGVPEFWRYNGKEIQFYHLQDRQYVEVEASPTFPYMPKARFYQFVAQAQFGETQASKALRTWIAEQASWD